MVKYKVANLVKLHPFSINIYVEVNVIMRTKVMPCSGIDILHSVGQWSRSDGQIIHLLVIYVRELLSINGSGDMSLFVS